MSLGDTEYIKAFDRPWKNPHGRTKLYATHDLVISYHRGNIEQKPRGDLGQFSSHFKVGWIVRVTIHMKRNILDMYMT